MSVQLVTKHYNFGLGALVLSIDSADGSPIDWNTVMEFASNMVGATNRGWTSHYAAMVKDTTTGALLAFSLQAAGEGVGLWLSAGRTVKQFPNDPFGH